MADNKVNSGLLEFSEDQKVFVALDAETSEVKKAVTIDGDGVETDIQGVQPSGKKEITSTAEVNVASYATAQVVDEDLVAGNIKKDVDILGVVGSYEPEAPASDYTTAEVRVVNNTGSNVQGGLVTIIDEPTPMMSVQTGFFTSMDMTVEVPLYKGVCTWIVNDPNLTVSVTGNITNDSGMLTITGNGSITITTE